MLTIGFVIGTIVLAVGFIFGVLRTRGRNRVTERVRDQATNEIYDDPNYGQARHRELEDEIKRG